MKLEKLLAIPTASILALSAAGCSDEQAPGITCTYVAAPKEIPVPAYWAITAGDAWKLIEPNSELAKLITEKLGSISTQGEVQTGDIFIATESSFYIDPESLGIDRQIITYCQPSEGISI